MAPPRLPILPPFASPSLKKNTKRTLFSKKLAFFKELAFLKQHKNMPAESQNVKNLEWEFVLVDKNQECVCISFQNWTLSIRSLRRFKFHNIFWGKFKKWMQYCSVGFRICFVYRWRWTEASNIEDMWFFVSETKNCRKFRVSRNLGKKII